MRRLAYSVIVRATLIRKASRIVASCSRAQTTATLQGPKFHAYSGTHLDKVHTLDREAARLSPDHRHHLPQHAKSRNQNQPCALHNPPIVRHTLLRAHCAVRWPPRQRKFCGPIAALAVVHAETAQITNRNQNAVQSKSIQISATSAFRCVDTNAAGDDATPPRPRPVLEQMAPGHHNSA